MRPQDLRDLAEDKGWEDYTADVYDPSSVGGWLEAYYLAGWEEAREADFLRRWVAERKTIHYPVAHEVAS